MSTDGKMRIGLFLMPFGHHSGGWRHPQAEPDSRLSLQSYIGWARTAERGKFDTIFLADTPALFGDGNPTAHRKPSAGFEPLTLLSAIAGATEHVGLISTGSTTYNLPYNLARQFASLDHLSGGRAGWNVVTSWVAAAAHNFGLDAHPEHGARYERAHEFVEVVRGLWDSWEDDAFLRDKENAVYYDPDKVHKINHVGEHYKVRGPLNVPRPIQGHPVLVQAGASDTGRDVGAEIADVIFVASPDIDDAKAFYADVKARVAARGRDPEQVKVLPGVSPIIGRTQEEAEAKLAQLHDLVPEAVALDALSQRIGYDLSGYDPDGPLPEMEETNGGKSRQALLANIARRDNLTIRQLARTVVSTRGFFSLVGTPETVADTLEQWFREGAADGFNIMPPYMPGALNEFVDQVVPILQARGLFREEYEGRTLRENLGLKRPENRFTLARAAAEAETPKVAVNA